MQKDFSMGTSKNFSFSKCPNDFFVKFEKSLLHHGNKKRPPKLEVLVPAVRVELTT